MPGAELRALVGTHMLGDAAAALGESIFPLMPWGGRLEIGGWPWRRDGVRAGGSPATVLLGRETAQEQLA